MSTTGHSHRLSVLKFPKQKREDHVVGQVQLEMILGMRRELMQMEESIAIALSKGGRVEPGIHSAELVPERRPNAGRDLIMKLVVLVVFFAALPAVSRTFEDVNGDGKIDVQDFVESGTVPAASGKTEAPQNA